MKKNSTKRPGKKKAEGQTSRAESIELLSPALSSFEQGEGEESERSSKTSPGTNIQRAEESQSLVTSAATVTIHVSKKPGEYLFPYQSKWAKDKSRFKIGMMSRQVGKDFSSGAEGVADCFVHEQDKKRIDWLIAAPSERQSLESLDKWKHWAEALQLGVADYQVERAGGSETLLKSATIVFPKGSRIIAVPGRPDTVRGYSANVLMTEFAFFENPDLTWRAVLPSITNPKQGGVKKVRLISTPNGVGNKFHDLWVKNYNADLSSVGTTDGAWSRSERDGGDVGRVPSPGVLAPTPREGTRPTGWSCHLVTIYDAVAQGLPIDIEELRSALDDPEGWAQEFECQFMDSQGVLLPYELIASCESSEATTSVPPEFWNTRQQYPIDLGIDFGRKKDLTVSWALQKIGDVSHTSEVLELPQMSTPKQEEILRPRIERARRVCLDYTGPGVGLGDYLVERYGQWDPERHLFGKIELCTFTNSLKVEIFSKTRMAFEQKRLRVPVSRTIREDLHLMNRVTTAGGAVSYRASHTADGHADRCTALALAIRAQSYGGAGAITSTEGIRIGGSAFGVPVFQPWRIN